jgi:hypothetical protein
MLKRFTIHFIGLAILLTVNACQTKKLSLDLIETACKDFKLSDLTMTTLSDPSCGGGSVTGSIKFVVPFSGETDCIDNIKIEPTFYRANNTSIANVSSINSLPVSSTPGVVIANGAITFIFDYQFANATDADALNHILFRVHTENEVGNQSNIVDTRYNATCSTVDPSTYTVKKTENVSSSTVQITLYDDGAEDGDIISMNLNDSWVLENYSLTNAGATFSYAINSGSNLLVFYAVNQGSVGPNTCAISINGGPKITLSPELLKGQAVNIVF